MWECSTLFVHLRWLLIKLGRGAGRLFLINGITMIITFFGCRILWGFYSSHELFQDARAELAQPFSQPGIIPPYVLYLYMVANVSLNMLNSWWFYLMLRGAAQAIMGKNMGDAGRSRSD